jgi:hypothetical protein
MIGDLAMDRSAHLKICPGCFQARHQVRDDVRCKRNSDEDLDDRLPAEFTNIELA